MASKSRTLVHKMLAVQISMLEGVARLTDDRIEIRNQMIHGIMAGQDTLASVTGNTIFALSKNPSYWAQLHEQMGEIEDGPDLADRLRASNLLQNIISECKYYRLARCCFFKCGMGSLSWN